MNQFIQIAVSEMKCLEFMYEGYPRVVEPHCFGISAKGKSIFRGYQISGFSSSGKLSWKLFDLDKVENLIVLDEYFKSPRLDYRKGDKSMKKIIIEV